MSDIRSAEFIETCSTSLTINNLPVRLVGVVLAVIENAGLEIEINIGARINEPSAS